jgi:hypothetical protein
MVNGGSPIKRAGSRLRSELRRKAFGRDVTGEVSELQAALGALHVAVADAVRDLGEDLREGLRHESLRRTDLLVERIDRKVEGMFAELAGREDLGTFFTGDAYAEFDARFGGPGAPPSAYVGLFDKGPVVDLACREGEVLDALRDAGVEAYGVAAAALSVDAARARGFEVFLETPVEHLARLADGSLGGALALQVAEHLPVSAAGQERWLRDPTHRWAIHPDTLKFIAGRAGFDKVRVGFIGGDKTSKGAPDYALVARRPPEDAAG